MEILRIKIPQLGIYRKWSRIFSGPDTGLSMCTPPRPGSRDTWHVAAAWQENCSDWPLPGSSEPDSLWWPDTDDEWSTWFISPLQSQSAGFNVTCDQSEDNQRNSFCQKSYHSIFFTSPKASQWKQKTLLKHLNDECNNSINSQFWAVWG